MSHGSAHIGKHIGNKKKEKTEKTIKKAEEIKKKNEELYGRESEQSDFLEAPYIPHKLNKKSNDSEKEKEKENQNCKVGCITMGGKNKTKRRKRTKKGHKKSKRRISKY
jgi:hypothetical protein